MDIRSSILFKFVAVTLVLGTIVRCAKEHPIEPARGVQVTGGGNIPASSVDLVNQTLTLAIDLAVERDLQQNIFAEFWMDWGQKSRNPFIKSPARLFPGVAIDLENGKAPSAVAFDKFESANLKALSENRITKLAEGNCLTPIDGRHTDASVSSLTLGADICFSIGNLTHIPPSTLLREILSLVLHEAVHLGGAPEPEAIAWQEEFTAYFGARFGDLSTDEVTPSTLKSLASAKSLIGKAISMARINPNDPRVFNAVGNLGQQLASLPYFQDPLALKLKINPDHPELIQNYSKGVLALIQKIQWKFEMKPDVLHVHGLIVPLDFKPIERDQVMPALLEISEALEQISNDFLFFVGTKADAGCISSAPDTDAFFKNFDFGGKKLDVQPQAYIPQKPCPK